MGELGKNDFCFVVAVYDNGQEVFPPPRSFPSKIIQLSVAILLGKVTQQLITKMGVTNEVLSCHVMRQG